MPKKKTHAEYEKELLVKEINYVPLEEYISAVTPILHECFFEHSWRVRPNDILSGQGCPICAGTYKRTLNEYKQNLISKNIYYEPIGTYINNKTPIKHRCSEGHEWLATPNNILAGNKCPKCSNYGFDNNSPAILYYIKIGNYYKIGITNKSVKERFYGEPKEIVVLGIRYFETGAEARDAESTLLNQVKRVHIPGFIKSGGNTELFEEPLCQKLFLATEFI